MALSMNCVEKHRLYIKSNINELGVFCAVALN